MTRSDMLIGTVSSAMMITSSNGNAPGLLWPRKANLKKWRVLSQTELRQISPRLPRPRLARQLGIAGDQLSELMDRTGCLSITENGMQIYSRSSFANAKHLDIESCGCDGEGSDGADGSDSGGFTDDDGDTIIGFVYYGNSASNQTVITYSYDTYSDSGSTYTSPTYSASPPPTKPVSGNCLAAAAASAASAAAGFAQAIASAPAGKYPAAILAPLGAYQAGALAPLCFLEACCAILASAEFLGLLIAAGGAIGAYFTWKACFDGG